jgi:hypothetical protein
MAMQYDVSAVTVTSTTTAVAGPVRVKGLTLSYAANGTIALADGATGKFSFTAPNAAGSVHILVPGEGIRFTTNVNATVSNVTAVVYYG